MCQPFCYPTVCTVCRCRISCLCVSASAGTRLGSESCQPGTGGSFRQTHPHTRPEWYRMPFIACTSLLSLPPLPFLPPFPLVSSIPFPLSLHLFFPLPPLPFLSSILSPFLYLPFPPSSSLLRDDRSTSAHGVSIHPPGAACGGSKGNAGAMSGPRRNAGSHGRRKIERHLGAILCTAAVYCLPPDCAVL